MRQQGGQTGTKKKKKQKQTKQLKRELRFWRSLWQYTSEVVVFTDLDGKIIFSNPAAEIFLACDLGNGQAANIFDFINATSDEIAAKLKELRESRTMQSALASFKSRQSQDAPVLLTVDVIRNGKGSGILWIMHDISQIVKLEKELIAANAKLQEETRRDYLTGIFNRRYFEALLGREIERAKRFNHSLALLFIDIDDFKCGVNDKYGHHIGDAAIIAVTKALGKRIRKIDMLTRWGGEEFAIICPETDQDSAMLLAGDLRREIEKLVIEIKDAKIKLTISIGAANFISDGTEEGLIKEANLAMHYAKDSGRNRVWHASWPIERAA